MEKRLNHLLADFVVEYHKLQNYHWYVKGPDFFTAHAKLEEYYDMLNAAIDEVAENILMLKYKPIGSLATFLQESSIKEATAEFRSSAEVFEEVLKDFTYLLKEVMEIKKLADTEGNSIISALMDNYINEFKKIVWMLEQGKMQ